MLDALTLAAIAVVAAVPAFLVGQGRGITIERRRSAARDEADIANAVDDFGPIAAGVVTRSGLHLRRIK